MKIKLLIGDSFSITRAGIQGLEDDFNSTIIFKVLTRSFDLLLQNVQT